MNDIKISLTMSIPGREMYPEHECSKPIRKKVIIPKTRKVFWEKTMWHDYNKCNKHELEVSDGKSLETITFYTRKSKPAKQSMKLSMEAYENFITSLPKCIKVKKQFDKLDEETKVELHLQELCIAMGGTLESFHIYED